jgi:hypothetical protein
MGVLRSLQSAALDGDEARTTSLFTQFCHDAALERERERAFEVESINDFHTLVATSVLQQAQQSRSAPRGQLHACLVADDAGGDEAQTHRKRREQVASLLQRLARERRSLDHLSERHLQLAVALEHNVGRPSPWRRA